MCSHKFIFATKLKYIKDGHPCAPYLCLREYKYHSTRYKKHIKIPAGRRSDGATGAWDIRSTAWWVHDELCKSGCWDGGEKITNWQCSQVLSDILLEEGRWARALYWRVATFLFGGGKARENGMFRLI